MVLKNRIDHDSIGLRFANIPRGPRSIRKRVPYKKSIEDDNICAFELLASLADKLLQETETSSSSNSKVAIKQDITQADDDNKAIKAEYVDPENCQVSVVSEVASQNGGIKHYFNSESDAILERSSTIGNFTCPDKFSGNVKFENCDYPDLGKSIDGNLENEFGQRCQEATCLTEPYIPKDPLEMSLKLPASINSNGNVKLPSCRSPVPNASFTRHRNATRLGSVRDDDEKFSRFNKLSTKFKAHRTNRIGDRRIKKLLTSKYWKVAPTLKEYKFSKPDGGTKKPLYHKRKTCYERFQRNSLYKRNKISYRNSVARSDGVFSCESVSNSPQKDSHVKFSIKSFKVPELFIEVPETATVGSLKRTVMEAVNAILGGGIHIGVVAQGKKVRDNNRTLSQTGISSKENINSVGFTLEPRVPPPRLEKSEDFPLSLLPCETPPQEGSPVLHPRISDAFPNPSLLTNTCKPVDCTDKPVSQFSDMLSTDHSLLNSRSIKVVRMNHKSRQSSELVQRRTRRPFSVTEVESLVEAVEQLGTGRWRDVKLHAFENACHRTYVDLKDKWKTLVHTSQIGPQQRRGEPVPQELLDRVLAAHAYWSKHRQGNPSED